jgi:hypothetical protein
MIHEVFTKPIQTEERKQDLDLKILKKRGNEKTFSGYMIQRMKLAREEGNFELCAVIQHFYKKHLEYQTMDTVRFENWKGKSGIRVFLEPSKIIVIRHQKKEPDSEPTEIRTEILKQDINDVITAINKINKLNDKKEKIESSTIACTTYQEEWKDIFSNRSLHIQFTHILGILDYYGLIHYYRSGKVQVLKEVREIQEVLK